MGSRSRESDGRRYSIVDRSNLTVHLPVELSRSAFPPPLDLGAACDADEASDGTGEKSEDVSDPRSSSSSSPSPTPLSPSYVKAMTPQVRARRCSLSVDEPEFKIADSINIDPVPEDEIVESQDAVIHIIPAESPLMSDRVPHHVLSSRWRVALALFGITVMPSVTGYFQEAVLRSPTPPPAESITFVSFFIISSLASIERLRRGHLFKLRAPIPWYLGIATMLMLSNYTTNAALKHISYPTKVVFSTAKVLPVMLLRFRSRAYSFEEYASAFLFLGGVCLFAQGDMSVQSSADATGIWLMVCAVITDGAAQSSIELLMLRYKTGLLELVQWAYGCGAVVSLGIGFVSGSSNRNHLLALRSLPAGPVAYLIGYSSCGYLGLMSSFTLIEQFDGLTAVLLGSLRKIFNIGLSFLLFPKPFTSAYLWAFILIVLATICNVHSKTIKSRRRTTTPSASPAHQLRPPRSARHRARSVVLQSPPRVVPHQSPPRATVQPSMWWTNFQRATLGALSIRGWSKPYASLMRFWNVKDRVQRLRAGSPLSPPSTRTNHIEVVCPR